MQIVIPMSGFGERFRKAGYTMPKPLIEVEGKTMIEHVVDLFPGETDLTFICNEAHLADPQFRMRETLERACPTGRICSIEGHKLGPVHAVLQVVDQLDPSQPTIVNYCDFTNWWSFADFKAFVAETECAGALPAYRGFHPHSLRGGMYAFIRERGLWAYDIREKEPFTDRPMDEFASSGTYYFRSAALMQEAMQDCVDRRRDVRGEYYVSMVYKSLFEGALPVAVYDLQHFMQWGTPEDLRDYLAYSHLFRALSGSPGPPAHPGATVIPAAGDGLRFADAGYALPKALIPVSGRPMIVQALSDLPRTDTRMVVLRRDMRGADAIASALAGSDSRLRVVWLDDRTDGQARTCAAAMPAIDENEPVTIGACDNGLLYSPDRFDAAFRREGCDVLVWGARGHPDAPRRPQMFGWIDAVDEGRVRSVSVKVPLRDGDPQRDPIVVGAATFRRAGDFTRCFDRLVARDARVNGELYLDSLINDAIALGLDVRLFEVDGYLGWGTPDDLRVFEYWQSCFHKWPVHPYRLESDRHVPADQVAALARRYSEFQPARPVRDGERLSVSEG